MLHIGENNSCCVQRPRNICRHISLFGLKMYVACELGHSKEITKMTALRFEAVGYRG